MMDRIAALAALAALAAPAALAALAALAVLAAPAGLQFRSHFGFKGGFPFYKCVTPQP